MSDNTMTEEVRARFARNIRDEHDRTWQSGAAEFDRWLAEFLQDYVPKSWGGLMALLEEHYPADVFPTLPDDSARDLGPRIISLSRHLDAERTRADEAQAKLATLEKIAHDYPATTVADALAMVGQVQS